MSDLIHKIVGKIIEVGQSDTTKFRLGETIRYTPSEILEILKQYESEIFGEESSTQTNASNVLSALDTISRQEAIDALIEWYGCKPNDIEAFEKIIEALPSVQPVIRCKDCKNFGGGTYCYERDGMWDENDFCSNAERRTDE